MRNYDDERQAAIAIAYGRGWELAYAERMTREMLTAEWMAWERADEERTEAARTAWEQARAALQEAMRKERQAEKVARAAWDWADKVRAAAVA